MDNQNWIDQTVDRLNQHVSSYEDRALLAVLKDILDEQEQRIEQARGELDGRSWTKW